MRRILLMAIVALAVSGTGASGALAKEHVRAPKIELKHSGSTLSATILPGGSLTSWEVLLRYENTCPKKDRPCEGYGYEGVVEEHGIAPFEEPEVEYVDYTMTCSHTVGGRVENYAYRVVADNSSGETRSKWVGCKG